MRDMATYFSSFRPDGSGLDLYSQLMTYVVRNNLQKEIIFSTLNYDCIFELAVSGLGLKVDYFSNTPSSNKKITFWKLHGSCNFIPKNIQARGIQFTRGISFNAGIQVIQPNKVPSFCRTSALYPSMSIFVAS